MPSYSQRYLPYLDQPGMQPFGPVSGFPPYEEPPPPFIGEPDTADPREQMPPQQPLRPLEPPPMPEGRDALYLPDGRPRQSTFLNIPTHLRSELQRENPRYEDINPPVGAFGRMLIRLTGGNYERDYAGQKQQYESRQLDQQNQRAELAQRNAMVEANLWKTLMALPPGTKRKPIIGLIQRHMKAQGVELDPAIVESLQKDEADELAMLQSEAQGMMKEHPDLDPQELMKYSLSNPAGTIELLGRRAQRQQEMAKTKKYEAEGRVKDVEARFLEGAMSQLGAPEDEGSLPSPPLPSGAPSTPIPSGPTAPRQQGASMAERHNNPLNIKAGPATQKWIQSGHAQPGEPATDGGRFLKFASADVGMAAAKDLLAQPLYANKSLDDAMKTWSNGGYGGDIVPGVDPKTRVGDLNPTQKQRLVESMARREQGLPRAHSGALAERANPQERSAVQHYDQAINRLQDELKRLEPAAVSDVGKRLLDQKQKTLDTLLKQREHIEKRYEGQYDPALRRTAERLFPGTPIVNLTTKQRQAVATAMPQLEAEDAALKAQMTAEAELPAKTTAAAAGNAGAYITDTNEYRDPSGNPAPVGATKGELKGKGYKQVKTLKSDDDDAMNNRTELIINLQTVADNYGAIATGPVEGRIERFKQAFGIDVKDQTTAQRMILKKLENDKAFEKGGKALTANEIERIKAELPQDVDPPDVFRVKLNTALTVASRFHQRKVQAMEHQGYLVPDTYKPPSPRPVGGGGQTSTKPAETMSPAMREALDILKGVQ